MAVADKINVNKILDKTLPVFTPGDVQKVSDSLTSIENAFNVIMTGVMNVTNITTAQTKSQRIAAREIAAETKFIPRIEAGAEEIAGPPLNVQPFKVLIDAMDALNKALGKLDLTPKPIGGGEQPPEVDIDIEQPGKSKRLGGSKRSIVAKLPRLISSRVGKIGRVISIGVSKALRAPAIGREAAAVASNVTKSLMGIALGSIAGVSMLRGGLGGLVGGAGAGNYQVSGAPSGNFESIMRAAAAKGDPHPELTAAQWALESGSGTSRLARELNNPFGQTTNKPSEGETVVGKDGIKRIFKRYASIDEAISHHVERWNKKYTKPEQTPTEALQSILSNRYTTQAEAPAYVSNITRILASSGIDPGKQYKYTQAKQGIVDKQSSGVRRLTGQFGEQRPGHMHGGIDIPGTTGEAVAALQGGTVKFAGLGTPGSGYNNYGNVVEVTQDNGYSTIYAHLNRISVAPGQRVNATQVVGELGSTGRSSGPHLHFEVRKDGVKLDAKPIYEKNPWIVGGAVKPEQASTPKPSALATPRAPRGPRVGMESLKATAGMVGQALTKFSGSNTFKNVQTR